MFLAPRTFPMSSVFYGKTLITPDGGVAIALVNNTGAPGIYGQLVKLSAALDGAYIANTGVPIGVTYGNSVEDGESDWIVTHGLCYVLLEDGVSVWHGDALYVSETLARATKDPLRGGIIAYATQDQASGTDVLCQCYFIPTVSESDPIYSQSPAASVPDFSGANAGDVLTVTSRHSVNSLAWQPASGGGGVQNSVEYAPQEEEPTVTPGNVVTYVKAVANQTPKYSLTVEITSNIATIYPNFGSSAVGDKIIITGFGEGPPDHTMYNGTFIVSDVSSLPAFSFPLTSADETTVNDGDGIIFVIHNFVITKTTQDGTNFFYTAYDTEPNGSGNAVPFQRTDEATVTKWDF